MAVSLFRALQDARVWSRSRSFLARFGLVSPPRRRPAATLAEPLERRRLLAGAAVGSAPIPSQAPPTTWRVDTAADVVDAADGRTSLREAINASNSASGPRTAVTDARIEIAAGLGTLSLDRTLTVTEAVSIFGNGATIAGDGSFRLMTLSADAKLVDLTLTGGQAARGGAVFTTESLRTESVAFLGNTAGEGGAVAVAAGELRALATEFDGNSAGRGGAVFARNSTLFFGDRTAVVRNDATDGGGLFLDRGKLTMNRGRLTDNAAAQGGAIATTGAEVRLTGVNVVRNRAQQGGAVDAAAASAAGAVVILDGTTDVAGNTAIRGGGIAVTGSILRTQRQVTIDGNTAANASGQTGFGGGVWATGSRVNLNRSTLTGNDAASSGGAAYGIDSRIAGDGITALGNRSDTGGFIGLTGRDGLLFLRGGELDSNFAIGRRGRGGAAYAIDGSRVVLRNASLVAGEATQGGGVFLSGGVLNDRGSTWTRNAATQFGGAIAARGSEVTLVETAVAGNAAGTDGGGIAVIDTARTAASTVAIRETAATGNRADNGYGGALFVTTTALAQPSPTRLTVQGGDWSGNSARFGGAVAIGSTADVSAVTDATIKASGTGGASFSQNFAFAGGAIYAAGQLELRDAAVTSNSATNGGGLFTAAATRVLQSTLGSNVAEFGGGWFLDGGDSILLGSAVTGNVAIAFGGGGGVLIDAGDLTIGGGSAVVGNSPDNVTRR